MVNLITTKNVRQALVSLLHRNRAWETKKSENIDIHMYKLDFRQNPNTN